MTDYYEKNSQLSDTHQAFLNTLMTQEGRDNWDRFIIRKRGNKPKGVRPALKEKKRVAKEVFTRLCDTDATDEVQIEFLTEQDRLRQIAELSRESNDPGKVSDSGPNVSI